MWARRNGKWAKVKQTETKCLAYQPTTPAGGYAISQQQITPIPANTKLKSSVIISLRQASHRVTGKKAAAFLYLYI